MALLPPLPPELPPFRACYRQVVLPFRAIFGAVFTPCPVSADVPPDTLTRREQRHSDPHQPPFLVTVPRVIARCRLTHLTVSAFSSAMPGTASRLPSASAGP